MIDYKQYLPFTVFVLLAVLSVLIIRPFLVALILGGLAAYIFYPFYGRIQQKIHRPSLSAFITCALVLLALTIPLIFFAKVMIQESYVLYVVTKQKLAIGVFENCTNQFCMAVEEFSQNPDINYRIQETIRFITDWIIVKGSDFLVRLPRFILNLLVIFVTMFYFLKDGRMLVQKAESYLAVQKSKITHIINRFGEIVQGVVYGYFLVALIQGALGALGFFLFGVSSPILWGLVMAFLALIPFVGTGIVWAPAALLILLDGLFQGSMPLIGKGIGLFAYGLIIISSLDNFIRPKLVSGKAKIHPAIILLGILGGALVFGPAGVILGPLVLALTVVVIKTYSH